jgi:hypothetical protein
MSGSLTVFLRMLSKNTLRLEDSTTMKVITTMNKQAMVRIKLLSLLPFLNQAIVIFTLGDGKEIGGHLMFPILSITMMVARP